MSAQEGTPTPPWLNRAPVSAGALPLVARGLASEDRENPEYDRALVELVLNVLGLPEEHRQEVERFILAPLDHTFEVTVSGCTSEQAEQVMTERLGPDEDYGFDYEVGWAPKGGTR